MVSQGTFSKVLDKVKNISRKGVITGAMLTALLGGANFSNAQVNQLKQAVGTEQSVSNKNSGLVMCTVGHGNVMSIVTAKWEIKIEKNTGDVVDPSASEVYVGYLSTTGSEPKAVIQLPVSKEGKEIIKKKLMELAKSSVEQKVGSDINWQSSDGINWSGNSN